MSPSRRLLPARGAALLGLIMLAAAVTAPPAGAQVRSYQHACNAPARGYARCLALIATTAASPSAQAKPLVTAAPAGYGPAQLASAYNLAAAAGRGGNQTVAIIDAQDDPNAEADLGVYRSQFGLGACTTANGCFRKLNQSGQTSPLPSGDTGWGGEISLDLDMVSAICPNCKILLIEASSASFANLGTAVNTAASLGATQISNSYGGGESSGITSQETQYYRHPGIDITVSSGDDGYGAEFPASSQYVTAVGGTTLKTASNGRGWSETVWNGAGSGCSRYIAKPAWQTDTGCTRRTVADVSAVADPNTGVAVYDTYGGARAGAAGWEVYGGTSVASPLIASVDALAGGRSPGTAYGSFAYNNPSQFFDVTSGSNGSCSGSYLCTGKVGYDGPTGIGSPNGAGAAGPPPVSPVNTAVPTISGTPTQGSVLSVASPGTWTGSPAPTFTYQWSQCTSSCTAVAGATGLNYPLGTGDVGKVITVTVTATNAGGSASATAAGVGPVTAPPPVAPTNTAPPTISGTLTQGSVLSVTSPGTWTGSPAPTFTYQWSQCTSAATCAACPTACTAIGGATGSSYTLAAGDVGKWVTVTVKATNTAGSASASATGLGPVVVASPQSFTLTASPSTGSSSVFGGTVSYTVTIAGQNGFNGPVTLAASGLPSGATASFNHNPTTVAQGATLSVSTAFFGPRGTFAIKITGTSGSLTASTSVTLTVR
jgi:hypothetical protein